MTRLAENGFGKVASVSGVDMENAGSTTLYTVDANKIFYPTHVLVRDPSASMAGGTSFSFTNWRQTVDLSSLTTLDTDSILLNGNNTKYTEVGSSADFQITVTTGTTVACTATIDVYGILVDA